MKIYAEGKNIPTYAFGSLFTQGEHYADTISFYVDRTHNGCDLMDCSFAIRGLTSDGWEVQQVLLPVLAGDGLIRLDWNVADYFTQNAGELQLELRASRTVEEVTQIVLKYIMQPVTVRPTPSGNNGPLPETAEQAVSLITAAASTGTQQINAAAADGESAINASIDEIEAIIADYPIDEVTARLDRIEADTAVYLARPEVIPVTRTQYDSTAHKQNALYIITEEDTV